MADVNFGILQPLESMAPRSTQVVSLPNTQIQGEQMAMQGMKDLSSTMIQNRQLGMDQQRLDMEKARQPGLLQRQQLENQGMGLDNQTKQMGIQTIQTQIQNRMDRIKAYEDAKAKGGTGAGLDAIENKFLDQGDTESYLKMKENREKLQDRIAKDQTGAMSREASILHGIMNNAVPATPTKQDPQTGQVIPGNPGRTPLDIYTSRYNQIKRVDPSAPDPKSFRNSMQFEDTYVHPVLDTALPYQQQIAAQQKMQMDNKLYQAQSFTDQAKKQVQDAVNKYGVNSKEAQDAADAYTAALNKRDLEASGNNYLTSTIGSIGRGAQTLKNIAIGNGVHQNTPSDILGEQKSNTPKPTTSTTPVKMPSFNSKEEFQSWYSKQDPQTQESIKSQLGK